jgi:hypothetical protein
MEYINALDSHIEKTMSPFKKTFYLKGVLHLLIVLYAAKLAPELPIEVLSLFENQYFKLLIFSLILWTAQFSPSTAILISVAFMVSMNAVNKKALWEFLENTSAPAPAPEPASAPAPAPAQVVEVSPAQSIEAVKILAQAASSNEASPSAVVANVANIAAANVTTEVGANALKQLAEQAIVPESGAPPKVEEAIIKVVDSIPPPPPPPAPAPIPQIAQKVAVSEPALAPPSTGCYPIRRYDMSKVVSARPSDNSSNPIFEDHQSWPN